MLQEGRRVTSKSPIVRVEFEYADGTIQRLTGPPAEAWLEDMNNVLAVTQIRSGQPRAETYPWVWSTKADPPPPEDPFENYEGTD